MYKPRICGKGGKQGKGEAQFWQLSWGLRKRGNKQWKASSTICGNSRISTKKNVESKSEILC